MGFALRADVMGDEEEDEEEDEGEDEDEEEEEDDDEEEEEEEDDCRAFQMSLSLPRRRTVGWLRSRDPLRES